MLVIVVDDHEPGQLGFGKRFYTVKESEEFAIIPVTRTYGSAGQVTVDYETVSSTALHCTVCLSSLVLPLELYCV
eukprot:SAG22_NODE_742_length_7506_cov_16.663561_3_plen_75_part_00